MARISRKELEKRIIELENAVKALCKMHGTNSITMASSARWINEDHHPKLKIDLLRHPANTSYGYVSFEDLTKFVVDKKPLEFKEKDKELVTEVHPDGTEIKKVVDKPKDRDSWLWEMQRNMKMAGF